MRRKNKKHKVIAFLFSIILIGIGYAYLTANLKITGTTKIGNARFDVHFENAGFGAASDNVTYPSNSNSNLSRGIPIIKGENNSEIEWNATLNLPGDYYYGYTDIVNDGDIDAKLDLDNSTIKVKIGDGEEVTSTFKNIKSIESWGATFAYEKDALYTDIEIDNDVLGNYEYLNAGDTSRMDFYIHLDKEKITAEEWESIRGKNIQITVDLKYVQGDDNPQHYVYESYIYLDNPVITSSNSNNTSLPTIKNKGLGYNNSHKMDYTVNFSEPGEYYEFELDVVNDGLYIGYIYFDDVTLQIGDGEKINISYFDNLPEGLVYTTENFEDYIHICEKSSLKGKVRVGLDPNISEEALNALKNKNIKFEYNMQSYYQGGSFGPEKCNPTGLAKTRLENPTYIGSGATTTVLSESNIPSVSSYDSFNDETTHYINYEVIFNNPGDYYEYSLDAVNDAHYIAHVIDYSGYIKIDNGTEEEFDDNGNIENEFENIFDVEITDGNESDSYKFIEAHGSKTLNIKLKVKDDITEENLNLIKGKNLKIRYYLRYKDYYNNI